MDLLGTVLEKGSDIVAQLRAAHDGVVAEHDALVLQDRRVGDEFHLGHKVAAILVARGERAGPRRRVFQHRTLVRHLLTL